MNTHADQTQEDKSQAVSAVDSQMLSVGESTFQFIDNRPEVVAQKELQEMANNSAQVSQLKAFQDIANNHSAQQQNPIQKKENNTGLPDNLKTGMENLSGYSMDDVTVHFNSNKPVQFGAHAYAQGNNIHLGTGQEKHLAHEAWHVIQQKQGRVAPTIQMGSLPINDNRGLEREADEMGSKSSTTSIQKKSQLLANGTRSNTAQMQFAILEPLAAHLGVEVSIGSVALAMGIAPATLTLGLQALGALAVTWTVFQVINYFSGPAVAAPLGGDVAPHLDGDVVAPLGGDVAPHLDGDVVAHLGGDVAAHLDGDVAPHLDGDVVAPLGGDVTPHLDGDVVAPLDGDVVAHLGGNVAHLGGDVAAHLDGDVTAPLDGYIAAPLGGDVAPVVAAPIFLGRNELEILPDSTNRNDLFRRFTEIGNEIEQYELGGEDDRTHKLLALRGSYDPLAGEFYDLDELGMPPTLTFSINYSRREHGALLKLITDNLNLCVEMLNDSYAIAYPAPPPAGAVGTALTNTVTYNGTAYTTRETLSAAISPHTGGSIPINQAIGRMDTNSNVSNNNNLSLIIGGVADPAIIQLRAALHCSFGMGENGCALFFISAGAGAITLVGIGHHYQNNSKKYNIIWAAAGYPTGKLQFPGA